MRDQYHDGIAGYCGIVTRPGFEDADNDADTTTIAAEVDAIFEPQSYADYVAAERAGRLAMYAAIEATYQAHVASGEIAYYQDHMPQTD